MHRKISILPILFSLCLLSSWAAAQVTPTINASQKIAAMDTAGVEQKLIAIALKRPSYDITYRQIKTATHQLSIAKNSWLNLLSISINYNNLDLNHNNTPATATYVYPKYFLGLTIPIGYIFSRGSEIRIARENLAIAQDVRQEDERTIIADVKTKYRTYLVYGNMLAVQSIVVNDQQASFLQVEKNFRDGKSSIEDYSNASKNYNATVLQQLSYKLSYDQAKVDLEHMLGMTLEEALKQ